MKKKLISLLLCFMMLLSVILTGCSTSTAPAEGEEGEEGTVTATTSRNTMTLVWALICDEKPGEDTRKDIQDAVNKITKSKFTTQVILEYYTTEEYATEVEKKLVKNQEEAERVNAANKAWKKFVRQNKNGKNEDGSTYKVETEVLYSMFWEKYPEYEKYVQPVETLPKGETAPQTEAATETNENGIPTLAYPAPKENQIDIIYLAGYENYVKYIDNEWLTNIDGDVSEGCKILNDYIFPAFLNAAKSAYGGTHAIPNNMTIGDYTYLLLDKALMKKYFYSEDSITSLTSTICQNFLEDIYNYEPGYVPLLDNEPTRTPQNIKFWNLYWKEVDVVVDEETGETVKSNVLAYNDEFSSIGGYYQKHVSQNKDGVSYYQMQNIFANTIYTDQVKMLLTYQNSGFYGAGVEEERPFAAGIVVGDSAELVPQYGDDYHMIVVDYPRGDKSDLFQHMWGVTSYCVESSRAMEIITYLNTNSDFRNLIQYGIEGVHYELVETEEDSGVMTLRRLNNVKSEKGDYNDYKMDLYKTGNIFIAYPEEGMPADSWEFGKTQNREALVEMDLGFEVMQYDPMRGEGLNNESVKSVLKWTEVSKAGLDLCKTAEDVQTYIAGFSYDPAKMPMESLTEVQKFLLEQNRENVEDFDPAAKGAVKGIVELMNSDSHFSLMTDGAYYDDTAPDDKNINPETNKPFTNLEMYGPGEGLYAMYLNWARGNGYYKPAS